MTRGRTAALLLLCAFATTTEGCRAPAREGEPARSREATAIRDATSAISPRRELLRIAAARFDPSVVEAADRANCFHVSHQLSLMVAALELDHLDDAKRTRLDPEPYVRAVVAGMLPRWGTGGRKGECHPQCRGKGCVRGGGPLIGNIGRELAHALHRYGAGWAPETKEVVRRWVEDKTPWGDGVHRALYNQYFGFVAERLLVGEALCRAPLWRAGMRDLDRVFANYATRGGWETQSITYSVHDLSYLTKLSELHDPLARSKARALLEFELLASAHLYLPGGGLGTPHTRDNRDLSGLWDGRRRDHLLGGLLWGLVEDPDFRFGANDGPEKIDSVAISALATDYTLPSVIRSIFLDKGEGYRFTMLHGNLASESKVPANFHRHGVGRVPGHLWQVDVLPGGRALRSVSYGIWSDGATLAPSTYVRAPDLDQDYAIVYHYQPIAHGDTNDRGEPILEVLDGTDPDAAESSGYDRENMEFQRAGITLFDPSSRPSRWAGYEVWRERRGALAPSPSCGRRNVACRRYEDTRLYLPNWDHPAIGGSQLRRRSRHLQSAIWHVGRVGEVYVGVLPLGQIELEETRPWRLRDGRVLERFHTYIRLAGRSGNITELATTADFASLEDFADDLAARWVAFDPADPGAGGYPSAEFDTRGADGLLWRMRLEYWPDAPALPGLERRYLRAPGERDFEPLSDDAYFGLGPEGAPLMRSPFVDWDAEHGRMRVSRAGYDPLEYEWGELSRATSPVPPGCEATPSFATTAATAAPSLQPSVR